MNSEQQFNQWGQIVAKAWQDGEFKKRLLANPSAVLKEQGLETPAGVQFRVLENTDQLIHLTLPAKPREGELSDGDLENVAGGALGGVLKNLSDTLNRVTKPWYDECFAPPMVPVRCDGKPL